MYALLYVLRGGFEKGVFFQVDDVALNSLVSRCSNLERLNLSWTGGGGQITEDTVCRYRTTYILIYDMYWTGWTQINSWTKSMRTLAEFCPEKKFSAILYVMVQACYNVLTI